MKISSWFISFLLLLSCTVSAQVIEKETEGERLARMNAMQKTTKQPKKAIKFERDLKIGWDISNILVGAISPKRSGLDFSVDYNIKENSSAILELGNNSYSEQSDVMDYSSNGNYFRLGFDAKMNKKESRYISRDIFYLGARYAFASFNQSLENYTIYSNYWPAVTENSITYKNQAHWVETIAGFKVEIMKNIYLGLGFRMKIMILQSGDDTIKPAPYIPGFGKTSGSVIVGFNYNVYYNLPLNYSKKTVKRGQ